MICNKHYGKMGSCDFFKTLLLFGLVAFLPIIMCFIPTNTEIPQKHVTEKKNSEAENYSKNLTKIQQKILQLLELHGRRKGRQSISLALSGEDVGDIIEDVVDQRGALDTLSNLSNIVTALLQLRSAFKQELNETVSGFLARQAGQAATFFQSWAGGAPVSTSPRTENIPTQSYGSSTTPKYVPPTRPPGVVSDPYPGKMHNVPVRRETSAALDGLLDELERRHYYNEHIKRPSQVEYNKPEVSQYRPPEEVVTTTTPQANVFVEPTTWEPLKKPALPPPRPNSGIPGLGNSLLQISISVQARPEIGNLTIPQLDDLLQTISKAVSGLREQNDGQFVTTTEKFSYDEFKLAPDYQAANNFLNVQHPRLSIYRPMLHREFIATSTKASVPMHKISPPNFPPGKPVYWMNMYYPNGIPAFSIVTPTTTTEMSTTPKRRRRKTRSTTTTVMTTTPVPEIEYYEDT